MTDWGEFLSEQEAKPAPHVLWAQTGGGDAYRVAMLEAGHMYPNAPGFRKDPVSGEALQCGLTHDFNWSPWQVFGREGELQWEGRWCRTCATTQARDLQSKGACDDD